MNEHTPDPLVSAYNKATQLHQNPLASQLISLIHMHKYCRQHTPARTLVISSTLTPDKGSFLFNSFCDSDTLDALVSPRIAVMLP